MTDVEATKSSSRSQLLQAAAALMSERGSIEVSLSEIAQRSQLNSALVKYYFGSKNGLMMELVKEILGRALVQMDELVDMDLAPVEKLKLHIKGIITVYFRYPFVNRLIHAMFQTPETAREVAETISKPLAETQRRLLEEAVAQGRIREIDPMLFYFIVLGACDHIFFGQHILHHCFGVDEIDDNLRRRYTDTLLDMVLTGLLIDKDGATAATAIKSGKAA
ncbi:MAG: TetR family transcriptional regulator [Candidatus Brevundimonas colombiensis]|uniref:TetR family transcriptional regulator n=1 Tax=Candidatus Brevundimonas colombiensis TaxID=3121376 RepID=A0AAJ5X053_9CAUL|nr:TetR family transcriptional regulator [Brevundimonas sp.]WEK40000.1 MAG: TetR family transcriptional regulator [Brevundimonas sp.]